MENDEQARLRGDVGKRAGIAARALAFDPARYRHHLAHLNMSEDAQAELLEVVWRIMESAVDRAFGEDSAQLARIAGDNRSSSRDRRAPREVGYEHPAHKDDETLADVFRLSGRGDSKERSRSNAD